MAGENNSNGEHPPRDSEEAARDIGAGYEEALDPETLEFNHGRIDKKIGEAELQALLESEEGRQREEILTALKAEKAPVRDSDSTTGIREGNALEYLEEIAIELSRTAEAAKPTIVTELSYDVESKISNVANSKEKLQLLTGALRINHIAHFEYEHRKAWEKEDSYDTAHPGLDIVGPDATSAKLEQARKDKYKALKKARMLAEEIAPVLSEIAERL